VGRYALNENKTKNATTVFEWNETEWVRINEAENRICAALFGLFPPCTPLIRIGEKITQKEIALLLQADNVFGVIDGKILVKKE
jgi:arginine/lysine/ornithine decarboxylase